MKTTKTKAVVERVSEELTENKYVTFLIGDEIYAIEVLRVREVLYMVKMTEVTSSLPTLKGVMDLRGQIIPLIDARLKLKKTPKKYDDDTVFIIMEFNSQQLGLIVDSVMDIASLNLNAETELQELDTEKVKSAAEYVKQIIKKNDNLIIVLDIDQLFSSEELKMLNQIK
jgi:purine-binding chemotaxis protein CheW